MDDVTIEKTLLVFAFAELKTILSSPVAEVVLMLLRVGFRSTTSKSETPGEDVVTWTVPREIGGPKTPREVLALSLIHI